jgi:YggT family protein
MIIQRTFLFVSWAIQAAIVAVIVLMVLRLIVDGMDLNPFGRIHRTVRRLSDGLIYPVRTSLIRAGVDPKFAPVVVILVAIVVGYFVLWLAATLAATTLGLISSVRGGAIIAVLGHILYGALSIYLLLISARVVFSWGRIGYSNRVMRFLVDTTEPLLGPLRRSIPPLGWMDISPIVAILIVLFVRMAIAATLLGSMNFY